MKDINQAVSVNTDRHPEGAEHRQELADITAMKEKGGLFGWRDSCLQASEKSRHIQFSSNLDKNGPRKGC